MKFADIIRLRKKGKKPETDEEILIDIHHEMMKFYHCWIPIEEFRKTPIPTIAGLIQRIREDLQKPDPIPVVIMGFAKKSISSIRTLGKRK